MNYESFISAVEGLALMYQQKNPNMCVSVNRTDYGLELVCTPKEQARKEWVDQMLEEFGMSYADESEIILSDKKRKVLIAHFCDEWGDNIGYGIAKCSANDKFDENVGLAVAFAHFCEYPIPDFV